MLVADDIEGGAGRDVRVEDPTITIPSVRIRLSDGNLIKFTALFFFRTDGMVMVGSSTRLPAGAGLQSVVGDEHRGRACIHGRS